MNPLSALIPHKHVRFCDSLVGLAGFILPFLRESCTPDELWAKLQQAKDRKLNVVWPGQISFTSMIFAIDILFAIRQVELLDGARIRKVQT